MVAIPATRYSILRRLGLLRDSRPVSWLAGQLWLIIQLLAVPGLYHLYAFGLPRSADGEIHLLRLVLLDQQIRNGIFFPRWMPELMLGHGYPILNYYGPLTYYLGEAFHLVGLDYAQAIIACLSLLVVLAGCGMYRLARELFGSQHRSPALVAAVAYMYAPYLLSNVYIRGALAEVGAQAILPWAFWSIRRLVRSRDPRSHLMPVVLSLTGLALTHVITLLLPPMVASYVLVLWWSDRRCSRLGWLALAGLAAVGITTFFWLPLIGERGYLSGQAYELSAQVFMPENLWLWNNFLDMTPRFAYSFAIPFRLGLVQLLAAVVGLGLARRRDAEWLFLGAACVLLGLSIGAWALPLWLSNSILLVVQFPWRLLSLMCLPLAIFAGGSLLRVQGQRLRTGGAAVMLAMIVVANTPLVGWMGTIDSGSDHADVAQIAQYEMTTGFMGVNPTGEFRPRWATADRYFPASETSAPALTVIPRTGNSEALTFGVSSPSGGPLRLASLYFPAWQVRLDERTSLSTYPSTSLGLLTVDLPPGQHTISVTWAGTSLEQWATVLSLLALSLTALGAWLLGRRRMAAVAFFGVALAVVVFYRPAPLQTIQPPASPFGEGGVRLLGYRAAQEHAGSITLYPYWLVLTRPEGFRVRWVLQDSGGQVVSTASSRPYFNSAQADNWPPGSLIDDAYELALPPGLGAGRYQLLLQLEDTKDTSALHALGLVDLVGSPAVVPGQAPTHTTLLRFADRVLLTGYDVRVNQRPVPEGTPGQPIIVLPGESLDYTLYWLALGPIERDYRAQIQIVDVGGKGITGESHVAGAPFSVPTSWDRYYTRSDDYRIIVPEESAPELYAVQVRVVDPATGALLSVSDSAGRPFDGFVSLRPIRVVTASSYSPQHSVMVSLGDFADVVGYDLAPTQTGSDPGTQLTVTFYYRSRQPTPIDFTRFLHLESSSARVVAQQDGYPRHAANPTHAWVSGETIADAVILSIPAGAQPGEYRLVMGFYDQRADLKRVPLRNRFGKALPGDQLELTQMTIRSLARD